MFVTKTKCDVISIRYNNFGIQLPDLFSTQKLAFDIINSGGDYVREQQERKIYKYSQFI